MLTVVLTHRSTRIVSIQCAEHIIILYNYKARAVGKYNT